ncbi:MAG: hypothetical protein A3G08_03835 [Candidatus Magasanikbacteria bacterium RIFCSPLOWO2_12_FULL_47_9b]|nr:MAG: hypothetical protein A3I74_05000 [Candidatus Magasanikbacteria bacterium RIFCSPLOWO2_02_FULL_47_16]OGH79768.1 MAG: hypothetical protein A3C10_04150 [Candidatus Magasanikbacteria bacterium RIFCSPHIGHO2_02_FULL_48_18]OGH82555.1 MAG: hypothetical protein A3G08_03835 [Candidatus Magasanikbacteria bacterium RIFCSPLOWO2_12_FULL_47_9b]
MPQEHILYSIKRHRQAKRLRILVHGNGQVVVTAPMRTKQGHIERAVRNHQAWIVQSLQDVFQKQRRWEIPDHITQERYSACRARAKKFICERMNVFNTHYGFAYHAITVKDMHSRWGSCSHKKNLNFHYRLLFLPLYLADYVIVHEICHLKELNHSKEFWRLISETIPDYRERQNTLRQFAL